MNPAFHTTLLDQPVQASKDIAQQMTSAAKEAAQRGLAATQDAAQHATHAAKDMYQSAATRAEDTLVQSRQYVRENPLPVVLGAFTLGLILGCLLGLTRRPEPTLRDRFSW